MPSVEQRRYPRFSVRGITARTVRLAAVVLDLSRTGMQIESSDGLGVGKRLRFAIRDPRHQAEVEGRVQWSRLHALSGGVAKFRSGIHFASLLTAQDDGVWWSLKPDGGGGGGADGAPRSTAAAVPREPMLVILSPAAGARIRGRSVTVSGRLRDPAIASLIEVNGVPATVDGHRFEATVDLQPGLNELSAALATSGASLCGSSPISVISVDEEP